MSTGTQYVRMRANVGLAVLTLSLASCAEGAMAGPHGRTAPGESEPFFAAVVQHFVRGSNIPVRIDPRPLRPGSMLHSVRESDLLLADTSTIRLRTAVLARTGTPRADAVADWGCVFATGLQGPPPGERGGSDPLWAEMRAAEPDSVRLRKEACRRGGQYTSLAFGLPQAGTRPEQPRWWRIRAIRMMLHGWEVIDLFLEADPRGEWIVVEAVPRVGAFS